MLTITATKTDDTFLSWLHCQFHQAPYLPLVLSIALIPYPVERGAGHLTCCRLAKGRARKRHPTMLYRYLTHRALIREKEYPSGGVFERSPDHERSAKLIHTSGIGIVNEMTHPWQLLQVRNNNVLHLASLT